MTVSEFVSKELGEHIVYTLIDTEIQGCMSNNNRHAVVLENYKNQVKQSDYADWQVDFFEVETKRKMTIYILK